MPILTLSLCFFGPLLWAWGTGLMIAVMTFMILVSPVLVAPLFNDYRPMQESPLKEDILSMARANGVPARSFDRDHYEIKMQGAKCLANGC